MFCSVCFGGADPIMRGSLNAGIFVLLGVTGLVLACFAFFFVRLAQRARVSADSVSGEPGMDDMFGPAAPLAGRGGETALHPGLASAFRK